MSFEEFYKTVEEERSKEEEFEKISKVFSTSTLVNSKGVQTEHTKMSTNFLRAVADQLRVNKEAARILQINTERNALKSSQDAYVLFNQNKKLEIKNSNLELANSNLEKTNADLIESLRTAQINAQFLKQQLSNSEYIREGLVTQITDITRTHPTLGPVPSF